jgi:uncharacterized membrane protein
MNPVLIALTILYPFLVYAALGTLQPRVLALGLAILLLARFAARPRDNREAALVAFTACAFALVVAVLNSMTTLLFYPALINLSLLVLFGCSLWRPPTVVERIARLTRPDLPASGVVSSWSTQPRPHGPPCTAASRCGPSTTVCSRISPSRPCS